MKPRTTQNARQKLRSFRHFVCIVCVVVNLSAFAVPSNRWLLIVETSRAMQSRREATAQLTGNLILSGMNGQIHAGDTIGLWTFNNALHSGEFSLQTWTTNDSKSIAERTALFLGTRRFENRANYGVVLPIVSRLVTNSEFITVVLITSGTEKIRGTPYDDAISTLQARFQSAQEKAGMPFVTILRAQGGRIVDFKVNTPPLALEFPSLPKELLVTNVVAEKPVEVKPVEAPVPPPQPAPVAPPLIVHGKKPQPEPEPEIKTNVPIAVAPVVTNETVSRTTNAPPVIAKVATNIAEVSTQAVVASAAEVKTNTAPSKSEGTSSRTMMLVLGGALVGGAVVGLVFLLLRPRRAHASLITRSLDRDK